MTTAEESRQEIQELRDRVTQLAEASRDIAAELSLERLLQRIVDNARRVVQARYAALGVLDDHRHIQQLVTSGVSDEVRERIGSFPQARGLLGLVLDTPGPVRVDDIASHPHSAGFPPGHPVMTTFLGTPIRCGSKLFGNLYLADRVDGQPFTESDERLIAMYAAQAAIALENARLYQAMEQERNSLETILNSMRESVHTTDTQRIIARINRHGAALRGVTPEEALGRSCRDLFAYRLPSGELLCNGGCPVLQVLQTGQSAYIMEAELTTSTGKKVPVALTAAPLRDARGQIVGAVEVARDISQRKEVDELRNNIVSMVSHELRTPLLHIKGFSSSLLQPDVEWDEETRIDFIRTIDREADRLTRLVSDLLDMSRLESGRILMELQPAEVRPMLEGGIHRAAPFLQEHLVVIRHPKRLPRVRADTGHVERVLENLLENAAKYSPRGSRITLAARPSNGQVVISVADRGVGVPTQQRERIFEKFVRLQPERAQLSPGTGLGLSICKAIVEAHGGRIWVEGNRHKGSVFAFTLPVTRSRPRSRGEAHL